MYSSQEVQVFYALILHGGYGDGYGYGLDMSIRAKFEQQLKYGSQSYYFLSLLQFSLKNELAAKYKINSIRGRDVFVDNCDMLIGLMSVFVDKLPKK